jgi:cell wall-associated NlpC family hydrolase
VDVAGIAASNPANGGIAAVQSRINDIQSRFGGGRNVAFGTVLANQLGGMRTASSFSFSGGAPARLPAGSSPAVDLAQQYLGVPYVWGGESPSGFDCSGLVQYVYGQVGVDLPRTAADQARVGQPVAGLADARPGDLLAFHDPVDHIGIYAGNGLMVVAPKTGDVVKVQNVYETPTAIRRVVPPGGLSGAASVLPAGDFAAQRRSLFAALSSFTGAAS